MNTWIRRDFDSAGLTHYPVGPYLAAIQRRFGGVVLLCIDVSGSMSGKPLASAVRGAKTFAEEAVAAYYEVGVTLWHHAIAASIAPTRDLAPVFGLLDAAAASGGNEINPTLDAAHDLLRARDPRLDRVVVIFGDGDLGGKREQALAKAAAMRADDIRIITVGLGDAAARALDEISTESHDRPRTATADTIDTEIAGAAGGLRRHRAAESGR
ncbi:vWA domain-containing protein [Nocardia sp. alder85J]|uniref:vWA domain-containing protein n=1 Tax=Nocardia sp. alder85J TaxID=2862949 RepID=UPI001CD6626C|nr:vWA domain-containing protein [Nocardia sp. alder85J]MCX4090758.1 VWA domain-containing protein [Nocardia sp. alder85J]